MPEAPKQVFVERLALLRSAAGQPTYESIERGAGRIVEPGAKDQRGQTLTAPSHKRIHDWCNGRAVPAGWPQLELVLRVLIEKARTAEPRPEVDGLYGLTTWQSLWKTARESPDPESSVCPYRGLESYQQEHAASFHGRAKSIDALLKRLDGVLRGGGGLLMLVGPSGVGKSSLLRAGLVPAIQSRGLSAAGSRNWPCLIITPGSDPLGELVRRVPELAGPLDPDHWRDDTPEPSEPEPSEPEPDEDRDPPPSFDAAEVRSAITRRAERLAGPGARLVIVVDQFEEVFTLCGDRQREGYIEALRAAATPGVTSKNGATPEDAKSEAPALVLVGVRADFYERCLEDPTLAEALQERQMVLGPMTDEELHEAVVRPARAVGLRVEPGLVELLLRDAGLRRFRGGPTEAGVLPLLSHALAATWRQRKKGALTIEGYRETKGIHGAVEATAEQAWAELDADGQRAALYLLLKLTRIGVDGGQDTRGRCDKQQLLDQAVDRAAAEQALEVLVQARLVTLDAEWAQLAHEALLQAWPRLRHLIDEHREGLLLRQRVEEEARAWEAGQRDSSLLYRGARLEDAQRWAATADLDGPSELARSFLDKSIGQRRRRTWLLRTAVAFYLVLALVAGVVAVIASEQRDNAQYADVVAQADRLEGSDPSLAAQLYLVAHHRRPGDREVIGRVLSTQNAPLGRPLPGHAGAIYFTGFSPDGRTLATANERHTVQLWNLANPARPALLGKPLDAGASWVSAAVFSPNGRVLASTNGDGTVHLWDVTDPANPITLAPPLNGHNGSMSLLAFSPDSRTLATANDDHTVRLWNLADPAHPAPLGAPLTGPAGVVRSVAFSPDGRLLAAGGDDKAVLLWNVADLAGPVRVGPPLTGHSQAVHSVAFSPDGRTLATGSDDKTARLWDVVDPDHPVALGSALVGHAGPIWSVAFSPDGRVLATGSQDGSAKLWNITNPVHPIPIGSSLSTRTGGVLAVAFSPDGHSLVTGGDDGTTELWSLPRTVLIGPTDRVFKVVFSPDGHTLAVGSHDHSIQLWDVTNAGLPAALGPPILDHTGYVAGLAFSPDGNVLASESAEDKTVRLWNVVDRAHPIRIGQPIARRTQYNGLVAFSPNGLVLVTGDTDQTVQLWDAADLNHLVPLGVPLAGHSSYISSLAFSPDGRTLATASNDATVRLWNVSDPAHPAAIGEPINPGAGHLQAAFSPDGHTLAMAAEDKTVRLWDVTDPIHPVELTSLVGHIEAVRSVEFSPDGHTLASVGVDKTVQLWDVTDPRHPTTAGEPLSGHTGTVGTVAFSPDGDVLATGSEDESVMLWDLNIDHAIRRICSTTEGALTAEQWHDIIPELSYAPPC
ncbi:MAG TPA: AAA family ATPase [Pseudonocardia sp.]|jgi:WD40 repeat protein|nr:AAA family ATPase [Pseudonocardia sp.]